MPTQSSSFQNPDVQFAIYIVVAIVGFFIVASGVAFIVG